MSPFGIEQNNIMMGRDRHIGAPNLPLPAAASCLTALDSAMAYGLLRWFREPRKDLAHHTAGYVGVHAWKTQKGRNEKE